MRHNIGNLVEGQVYNFTATVERFGSRRGSGELQREETVLLTNVCRDGQKVTNHLWTVREWAVSHCEPGDTISFDAEPTAYIKGYHQDDYDFGLENFANVKVTHRPEREPKPVVEEKPNAAGYLRGVKVV